MKSGFDTTVHHSAMHLRFIFNMQVWDNPRKYFIILEEAPRQILSPDTILVMPTLHVLVSNTEHVFEMMSYKLFVFETLR